MSNTDLFVRMGERIREIEIKHNQLASRVAALEKAEEQRERGKARERLIEVDKLKSDLADLRAAKANAAGAEG